MSFLARSTRFFAFALLVGSTPALAQVRPGKLLVTVVDQTGAVIPGATVTAVRADDRLQLRQLLQR